MDPIAIIETAPAEAIEAATALAFARAAQSVREAAEAAHGAALANTYAHEDGCRNCQRLAPGPRCRTRDAYIAAEAAAEREADAARAFALAQAAEAQRLAGCACWECQPVRVSALADALDALDREYHADDAREHAEARPPLAA